MKRTSFICLIVLLVLSVFVSCNGDSVIDDVFCHYVTFDANGGTGTMEPQKLIGSVGDLVPNGFTKENHIFAGWNTEKDGSGDDYFNGAYIETDHDIVLYAQWLEDIDYVFVGYYPNGGTGTALHDVAIRNEEYNLLENEFTKEGYTFAGWSTDPMGQVIYADKAKVQLADDCDLYAKWNEIVARVTITYFGNDATSGDMEEETVDVNQDHVLAENEYEKDGCDFAGWALTADGDAVYTDGDTVAVLDEDIDLYAVWTESETSDILGMWSNGEVSFLFGENGEGLWITEGQEVSIYPIEYDDEKITYARDVEGDLGECYLYMTSDQQMMWAGGMSLEGYSQDARDMFIQENGTYDFEILDSEGYYGAYLYFDGSEDQVSFYGVYLLNVESEEAFVRQTTTIYDDEDKDLYIFDKYEEDLGGVLPGDGEHFLLHILKPEESGSIHMEDIMMYSYNETSDELTVPCYKDNPTFGRVEPN